MKKGWRFHSSCPCSSADRGVHAGAARSPHMPAEIDKMGHPVKPLVAWQTAAAVAACSLAEQSAWQEKRPGLFPTATSKALEESSHGSLALSPACCFIARLSGQPDITTAGGEGGMLNEAATEEKTERMVGMYACRDGRCDRPCMGTLCSGYSFRQQGTAWLSSVRCCSHRVQK
jgi:hypothetical protein